ncbi:hypothetical protein [Buchananella hordeovulneris]|uniref:hypothetical protein n=1 Tax=Buchananella hordeovulneris TaxID=52770 RepID=UPI000F5E0F78|nr:hypothetical protein [Buchananella hordeovulneris]RRD41675.1 hypothetical protein EII13_10910 [Buchananella hordeovulneris]
MSAEKWLKNVIGNTAPTAAARRAGVQPSTLTRQLEAGQISPEVAVKIARAFDAPVLDTLVSIGLITDAEAALKDRMGTETALETASDEALLRELLRRAEGDG